MYPQNDPSQLPVVCEHCGSSTHAETGQPLTVGTSYSIIASVATTGGPVAPGGPHVPGGTQCDALQHFACSIECAVEAHIACVREHLAPKHTARRQALTAAHEARRAAWGALLQGDTAGNEQ